MSEKDQLSSGRAKQNERDIERGENIVPIGQSIHCQVH